MSNSQSSKQTLPTLSTASISLPNAGGSLRSSGETFKPNAFSGTGSYNISIPVTQARGFEPQLNLNYQSGTGNGLFGIGFSLSASSISRRTEKGIPKYDGTDVFIWDGIELVPKLILNNKIWEQNVRTETVDEIRWVITPYYLRVEGNFAAIEQWTDLNSSLSFWKIITSNGTVSYYGKSSSGRIADSDEPSHIFQWLEEEREDTRGNKIQYTYETEDKNTSQPASGSNVYLSVIKYGNFSDEQGEERFAFEIVFDYGQREVADESLLSENANPYPTHNPAFHRPDTFSKFRSGFEIRTSRLCQHILLFHRFEKELGASPCLIRRTSFIYDQKPHASVIKSVRTTGCRRTNTGQYELKDMPPIDLSFSSFSIDDAPHFKLLQANGNLSGYLDSSQFLPVDLYGEGIPGFLYSSDSATFYLEPLGDGSYTPPQKQERFPLQRNIQAGKVTFVDLEGSGRLDLLVNDGIPSTGYYEYINEKAEWMPFQPLSHIPADWHNQEVEMTDLTGSGKTDLFLADKNEIHYYVSRGKKGYETAQLLPKQAGFPVSKKSSRDELIIFTGLLGDGLAHRVRIANGSVECWPNIGYGKFGVKKTLDNAPNFGTSFDAHRLYLADIDGSGTTDILYVYSDRIGLYINQSGNSFSNAITLPLPEPYSSIDQISFADIRGNGTTCLVFTKMLPSPVHYYYEFRGTTTTGNIDKQPAMKPYLLTGIEDNMGSAIQMDYCSSVKFYIEDKLAGKPWVSRLPFPVQVVEKISTTDLVAGATLTSQFKYHHGYYDFAEKSFCGFGCVESWDTEVFNTLSQPAGKDMYVPPVFTKAWYHTGAMPETGTLTGAYRQEYYQQDMDAYTMPDCILSTDITGSDEETKRQATIALKGTVLRQEVYGLDNIQGVSEHPYTVTESNLAVQLLQPKADQLYAVFLTKATESISYHYERNPTDPRVQQDFILATDEFGNVTKACSVFLPRRSNTEQVVYPEQQEIKAVLSLSDFSNVTEEFRQIGVLHQSRQYEIVNPALKGYSYFTYNAVNALVQEALQNLLDYGTKPAANTEASARLVGWNRVFFWNEEQTDDLPLGIITKKSLLHHTEEAVFTNEFINELFTDDLYKDKILTEDIIRQKGGYFYDNESTYWWKKSLMAFYSAEPAAFNSLLKTENSFVDATSSLYIKSTVDYDKPYYFSAIKTQQWLDETTCHEETALIDYITMAPVQYTDANGNTAQVLFDPIGQVIATTFFGKTEGILTGGMMLYSNGDETTCYQKRTSAPDGTPVTLESVIANPEYYLQGAASFFYYQVFTNKDVISGNMRPAFAIHLTRENHFYGPFTDNSFACQVSVAYFDGFGRNLQTKHKGDDNNWIVSGKVINNNKGVPCRQYLPYFSDTASYKKEEDSQPDAVPPSVIHYDPLLRVVRTDTPKGFFSKVEFTPWEERHYDENDTILESPYYTNHYPDKISAEEKDAADKAIACYDTPHIQISDSAGNVFMEIENNLGAVQKEAFATVTEGTILRSEDVWAELVNKGYLEIREGLMCGWVTQKFQPYSKNFSLQLSQKFQPFASQLLDYLRQSCLVSYHEYDILGRNTMSTDARLYYSNQTKGTAYYNFRYIYTMGEKNPLMSDSADAGTEYHFSNTFGNLIWSWSARNFNQTIEYDRLQRKTSIQVKGYTNDGTLATDNLVEEYTYGETIANAENMNLRGKLYGLKDQSGIVVNALYDIHGKALQTSRQFTQDYKTSVNWNNNPLLQTTVYTEAISYDALQRMVAHTTPDGNITAHTYKPSGLLNTVTVTYGDKTVQPIISSIAYDAKVQRTQVVYANGVTTTYSYEDTTLRLLRLKSTRAGKDAKGKARPEVLQDIAYTYDAVGNITQIRDDSFSTVFYNNQQVEPVSDYKYDALYRLVRASGRQHPGVAGNTFINNKQNGDSKQTKFMPLANDAAKLENYTELYTYDEAGNLVQTAHRATASWTRQTVIAPNSNRIKTLVSGSDTQDMQYDLSGNQKLLNLHSAVDLTWSCCENLVSAGIIQRPSEMDDRDYYTYDSGEMRTRKVSERVAQNATITEKEEKLYFGNYEVKTIATLAGNNETIAVNRLTLRIMDGDTCIAIVHYWVKDDNGRESEGTGTRKLRYQLDNHLGSVAMEVDGEAQLISYEEYFPYGGTAFIAGDNAKEVSLKEYRYSGKERDDSTGLYYYGARYYAPWLGRWLSADPAGRVDGMNVYAFCKNNPVKNKDSTGKSVLKSFLPNVNFTSKKKYKPQNITSVNIGGTGRTAIESMDIKNSIQGELIHSEEGKKIYRRINEKGDRITTIMIDGPGVSGGFLRRYFENIFGEGPTGMEESKKWLINNVDENSKVFITGYSRGAVIGGKAANIMAERGQSVEIDLRDPVAGGLSSIIPLHPNVKGRQQLSEGNILPGFGTTAFDGKGISTIITDTKYGGHDARARSQYNEPLPKGIPGKVGIFKEGEFKLLTSEIAKPIEKELATSSKEKLWADSDFAPLGSSIHTTREDRMKTFLDLGQRRNRNK